MLLVPTDPDPGDVLRRSYTQVTQAIAPESIATLVVGPTAAAAEEYGAAYRVALGAAELRRAANPGGLVDVRGLGLATLLLETGAPEALRRFSDTLLKPLVAHDARRHGDLVPTLRAWLQTRCSTAATAEDLVVHPNTVGYRLGRIEQLTGRNLRNIDTRLELQMAVIVMDIIQLDTVR